MAQYAVVLLLAPSWRPTAHCQRYPTAQKRIYLSGWACLAALRTRLTLRSQPMHHARQECRMPPQNTANAPTSPSDVLRFHPSHLPYAYAATVGSAFSRPGTGYLHWQAAQVAGCLSAIGFQAISYTTAHGINSNSIQLWNMFGASFIGKDRNRPITKAKSNCNLPQK